MVHDVYIAPSLLASDFGRLKEAAEQAETAGAEYLHFDVMDGCFVPNISFGMPAVKALRPVSRAFFDVHLMIVQPERYVDEFIDAGADGVTIQAESCVHLQRTLSQIRSRGAKSGIALNPSTHENILEYLLDDLDLILVMTVNPGFGGQKFLPAMLPKVRRVKEMAASAKHPIRIEVDGGITAETSGIVTAAGADVLVAGTSVYGYPGGVIKGVEAIRAQVRPYIAVPS